MADDIDDLLEPNDPAGIKIRLHKIATQRDAAREEVAALKARLSEMEASHAEALAERDQQIESLTPLQDQLAELQRAQATWTAERAIVSAGITDPEGIEFARMAFERIPEDERPKDGLAAWLAEDNRANLPRAVTAYFAEPDKGGATRTHNPDSGVRAEGRIASSRDHGGRWADRREEMLAQLGARPVDIAKLTGRG